MDFTSLFNNQKTVVRLLKNSFDNDRLFHTYLFSGPRGSLKMDAAIYLASLILCDNGGACGSCEECVNIDKWSNEHLFIVSPDGDSIKKEQIEALEHEFGYKSDHTRVFIIQQIDKATLTAANTLLKFLEDLPSNCFGIILTENINKVLPTIKSRSQIVNFLPISSDVVRDELIQKGIELEKAHIISKITNNLSIASRYTKSKNLDKAIDLVKHISEEIEQRNNPYFRASGSYPDWTAPSGSFGMWHHPRGYVSKFLLRKASSLGAPGWAGTPRQSRGIYPPVVIRRGESHQMKWCRELRCSPR